MNLKVLQYMYAQWPYQTLVTNKTSKILLFKKQDIKELNE